jgi:dipeptidyl aminopeptidase/acylaminoacyl peptidase
MWTRNVCLTLLILIGSVLPLAAQGEKSETVTLEMLMEEVRELGEQVRNQRHRYNRLGKAIDDVMWHVKLDDIAEVDKVRFTGPPLRYQPNKTAQGAGNPLIVRAYTFVPKNRDGNQKLPLMVLIHGGVHGNFNTGAANVVRELIEQGYVVVSPEYRGSTGYGQRFYEAIDYGGLEIEDTYASRNYMLENFDIIDSSRIGIMGWSHGGLHALMNVFEHPDSYKVAYAGVPVSDLVARMGYKTERYRGLYSADYHVGKSAYEDVEEYRRRSPAWNAHKLETPLLIHTNTNDADVNVLEVEHLIKSLKAEGKQFEYKIYEDAPGGHSFNRLDTLAAKESRREIYQFMARYLSPPNPVN